MLALGLAAITLPNVEAPNEGNFPATAAGALEENPKEAKDDCTALIGAAVGTAFCCYKAN